MSTRTRGNRTEALVGLAVVLIALAFVFLAWQRTGGGRGGLQVTALFPSASGIAVGSDVRVAGVRVGSVSAQRLDPESLQAEVTLALHDGLRIPADSSAAITTESLLGGSFIALTPGGAEEPLKHGDTILDTQGAVDMMSLIGGVINGRGASPAGSADEAPPAAATATDEPAPAPPGGRAADSAR